MVKAQVMESVTAQFDIAESKGKLTFLILQTTPEQKVSEYIKNHNYTDLA